MLLVMSMKRSHKRNCDASLYFTVDIVREEEDSNFSAVDGRVVIDLIKNRLILFRPLFPSGNRFCCNVRRFLLTRIFLKKFS